MKHINIPKAKTTFNSKQLVYEAHGTSNSVVLVKGVEMQPIDAWATLVNSGYKPETCPHCGKNVSKEKGLFMVGAHVLKKERESDMEDGDTCYIIPLCNSCNTSSFPSGISLNREVNALKVKF